MFKNIKVEKCYTKSFIIKTKNIAIKIPYALKGWKEIQQEKAIINEVRKDPCFYPHLLEYKYIFGCLVTTRLLLIEEIKESEKLIEKYFQKAFKDSDNWKKKPLRYLLDLDFFLDFISKNVPIYYDCLVKFLDAAQALQSSAHGDFHQKNILTKGNGLYFIDWSYYKNNSSRYFDLLDFYIYLKGEKHESWMKVWSRECNQIPDAIFRIKFPKDYFLAYAVWRASEEMKRFSVKNDLDKYKRKKYADFLAEIAGLISRGNNG